MNKIETFNVAALGLGLLSIGLPNLAIAGACPNSSTLSKQPSIVGSLCSIDITAYSHSCSGSLTSGNSAVVNGRAYTVICAADFRQAMNDAGLYFYNNPAGSGSPGYQLTLPAGLFYVPDTTGTNVVVPLPTGDGTRLSSPISSTERLLISGSTTGSTTLLSTSGLTTFYASPGGPSPVPFSHLTLQNISFDRDQFAVTQGHFIGVTSVTETYGSNTATTAALQFQVDPSTLGKPGFNVPDFGFQPPQLAGNAMAGQFLRIYDNVASSSQGVVSYKPQQSAALNNNIFNLQVAYHGYCYTDQAGNPHIGDDHTIPGTTTAATFSCPVSGANTLTVLLGSTPGVLSPDATTAVSSYGSFSNYGGPTKVPGVSPLVCIKNETTSADFFLLYNDQIVATPPKSGTDIVMQNLTWKGMARSALKNTSYISVLNSAIVREPPVLVSAQPSTYQYPCLSTESGGVQINGQSSSQTMQNATTYGNTISGYNAVATGDDSLAVFGDAGGSPLPDNSGVFPISSVSNSTFSDSFARAVVIYPTPSFYSQHPYVANLNVLPYISFAATVANITPCSGNGFGGSQGFNPAVPYPAASSCSTTRSTNSIITNTYFSCPYVGHNSTSTNVFCSVRASP